MALEETDRIDLIGRGDDGKLELVITDAGITTDPQQRFALLVEKIKTCVGYVIGEQFQRDNPGVSPADVSIRVMCANPPTDQMRRIQKIKPSGRPEPQIPVVFEHLPFQW